MSTNEIPSIDKKYSKNDGNKQLEKEIISDLKKLEEFKISFYKETTNILFFYLSKYNKDYRKNYSFRKKFICNYILLFRDELLINLDDNIGEEERFEEESQNWLNFLIDLKFNFDQSDQVISNSYKNYYFWRNDNKLVVISVNHNLLNHLVEGILAQLYESDFTNNS